MRTTRPFSTPSGLSVRGLSLVELMIALAVLGILVGIAAPNFADIGANQRLSSAVNHLLTHVQQARMRAVRNAGQVVLCPSSDGRGCTGGLSWQHGWLGFDDENGNRALDPDETVFIQSQPLPRGVLASATAGRPQLLYSADGSAAGRNLTITLCDRRGWRHGKAVVVNNGGRPRTAPAAADRCPS